MFFPVRETGAVAGAAKAEMEEGIEGEVFTPVDGLWSIC